MGRAPCCDKASVKKGPWSPEEDEKLKEYIDKHGTGGNWIALPQKAGLRRCGKSCRLRWLNYLRPNIRHGEFSDDEDRIICTLFASIGSRWSIIATQLPGRTDNDIKNYWNTKLKKKLMGMVTASSQKRPHHVITYPTSSPSSGLPSSSSSSYKCSNISTCYTTQTEYLTGYEPITIPSSLLNSSSCSSNSLLNLISQEGFVGPMHQYYPVKDSVFIFGGDSASCSSSDGSCNNNQISHGREMELEHFGLSINGEQHMGLQSYDLYSMVSNGGNGNGYSEKTNGFCGDASPIDYSSLEEIKQLISTNICNNLNFFGDENKTGEKAMYY